MSEVNLRHFDAPDEPTRFENGDFETVTPGGIGIGRATAAFAGGTVTEMKPGDPFYVPPEPHDGRVVGEEPYVSLHFRGLPNMPGEANSEGATARIRLDHEDGRGVADYE